MKYYIAVDLGATSGRVVLASLDKVSAVLQFVPELMLHISRPAKGRLSILRPFGLRAGEFLYLCKRMLKEIEQTAEVALYLWQKGWAERNGGNITVNIRSVLYEENQTFNSRIHRCSLGTCRLGTFFETSSQGS